MNLPRRPAPPLAQITQKLSEERISDVVQHTRDSVLTAGVRDVIGKGKRVAITAGSRGIGGVREVLTGAIAAVRQCGGEPFLLPSMGSHGGATAEGQAEILRRFDLATLDAPIRATMETVSLGVSECGAEAHLDRYAYDADAIIVVGRVKTHPESASELASGLLKMCTVGLGKQAGAMEAHGHGLWPAVQTVPKLQLAKARIALGLAIVENGYRQPVAIEAVPASYEAFLEADVRLLRLAKRHLATIPFDDLDVLIVDEIGKNISGAGMDPNVIGHWRISGGPKKPHFKRIAALSLTHQSLGNGLGAGLADFTTQRFADSYDAAVTYVNLVTASEPDNTTREGPLPLALPSDRDAIEVALQSSLASDQPRVCRIRNTAALDELWISEALLQDMERDPALALIQPPAPMPFDARGNLF